MAKIVSLSQWRKSSEEISDKPQLSEKWNTFYVMAHEALKNIFTEYDKLLDKVAQHHWTCPRLHTVLICLPSPCSWNHKDKDYAGSTGGHHLHIASSTSNTLV